MSLPEGLRSEGSGKSPLGEGFPLPFGTYLLLRPFARGGMGEVYLAKYQLAPGDERYCVLKKLRPELTRDTEYVRRFIDEARVVVQLSHANICQVFDVGRVGEEYYLAMEYVSGRDVRTLQDRARERGVKLPEAAVLWLLAEMLAALDYAHRRNHPLTGEPLNLIHRDVSPQNVMVSFLGAVKLIDFGLASSKLKMERTQPNVVMGKMAYMAPEQARGDPIDARVDLFAAGVVGYELLVGERYYEGMTAQEIWQVVGRGDFVPKKWGELKGPVATIIGKALAPRADKRYPSCAEFREAILRHLEAHHGGKGPELLQGLVAELFDEEIEKEREMLAGFGALPVAQLSEHFEASRSQSISLARSDLAPPTDEDGVVPATRVVYDESQSDADGRSDPTLLGEGPPTGGADIYGAPTLLDGAVPGHAEKAERPLTPPTGTFAKEKVRRDEHTELVRRAPGLERAEAHLAYRARALRFVAAAALVGVAGVLAAVLWPEGEAEKPQPAEVATPPPPLAPAAPIEAAEEKKPAPPPPKPAPAQVAKAPPSAPLAKEPDPREAERFHREQIAALLEEGQRILKEKGLAEEAQWPEEARTAFRAAARLESLEARLKSAQLFVDAAQRAQKPAASAQEPSARPAPSTKRSRSSLRNPAEVAFLRLSYAERIKRLARCKHACRNDVFDSFTKLKPALESGDKRARRTFDKKSLSCFRLCP